MTTFEAVLSAAKCLPDDDRKRLIDALFETFPVDDVWPGGTDEELDKRIAEVEAGDTAGTPWPKIRDEAGAAGSDVLVDANRVIRL